ncbi:MAG: adenosylcobalamin-dependent ribonucleoside-diphosphate reductase [Nitrospirae bacterium]|nr:adenosylcobalamin-dependent ribonucleoside-diphosphate reductase [Nitrospirota bacterium]
MPLSENQLKVIRDKYLRDAKSVEAWLLGVARNIALGDLLHSPSIPREKWLKGVRHTVVQKDVGGDATTAGRTRSAMDGSGGCGATVDMVLLHQGIHEYEEREKNFRRFMDNLLRLVEEDAEARRIVQETADKFYALLSNFFFLPNSPTLMNAGRALQQLSACYVLPVPDSIEGIFESVKNQALIHKSGGGTGFSFGRIRPKEDEVKTTKGIASGPVSFMKIFDIATEQVKQGGTRRGANMAIMPYTHPDIREFITMKGNGGILENFNISVGIDSAFIDAVRKDEEIELINPKTRKPAGREKARELFDLIIDYAWKCGDPGYVVLDRINNSHSNPTPALGPIEATNPCGEQPLLPNEPCNLGSITLSKFVRNGQLDEEGLSEIVNESIHFLDNVIDLNNYPTPEIELMAKGNRRIGLGVMGFAEMLVGLGIPYDGDEAIQMAEKVMGFINQTSLDASVELARQRGVFPNFKDSIHDKESIHFRGEDWRPRNCARTTIAPTGTIAIAAGLQGSGIEPFFAISYTRYNAKGLDAVKQGTKPDPKDVFYEVNPSFREVAARNGFFGLTETDLWEKINQNHGSVRGIPEIPKDVQSLFPTSHDVSFEHHIRIQAAFQKSTDNAVSKTINCTNDTTPEQMAKAYLLAYDLGCKGLTVYRDGSKAQQVLNLNKSAEAGSKKQPARGVASGTTSEYYEKPTGYGPLHVNIIYDDNGPYRIFTNLPPLGTEISGLTAVIGILLSKYLEIGGDPVRLLKHLNSVKGDKPYGFGPSRVDSIPHAISQVLRDHLIKIGKLAQPGQRENGATDSHNGAANGKSHSSEGNGTANATAPVLTPHDPHDGGSAARRQEPGATDSRLTARENEPLCPQCYSRNVEFVSGCKEPTCFDCGFSNCS